MSIHPSEPPSSPLISNSFLYNLPDPTLGIPTTSTAGRLDILPSPFKRSAIASLNKPLSHEQTQQLQLHKANAAASASAAAHRSPSKARSPGNSTRLQANLDAPGGLPTPPSSSEALTTTPRSATHVLAPLPREPVSPSPSRSRNSAPSPARKSPSKPSRSASTPRQSQRTPTRRSLRANDGADSSDDDHILRSTGGHTPKRMQSLKEVEEVSEDEDGEEEQEEEEIQLISFKRGGPDATFIREIKENGWDQPLPRSPIKFTYLEPVAPRPPRQSSVGARARSQSRSRTPQTRASPAPSHASTSRASIRARSVRASSAAAANQTNDTSNESIKSSASALTNVSRLSQARSKASSSGRRSIPRSSVAPPVIVADLTRDHPSLPDSPGDDPLLLTGPNTYIVYHDQTPSAKNRSTLRNPRPAVGQQDASTSTHSHSTPLPTAAAASASRRERSSSASSSASRSSLYNRMSGRQAADVSTVTVDDEEEQDEIQRTEHDNHAGTLFDEDDVEQEQDDAVAFLPFDDAGFASDSDQDEPAPVEAAHSSSSVPVQQLAQLKQDQAERPGCEGISSMSDVSRSFVDDSVVHDRTEVSGPVDDTFDASHNDDSVIVDQSLHAADQNMDASAHDQSESIEADEASLQDRTMETSAADHTAADDDIGEDVSASMQSPDAGDSSLADLSSSDEAASVVDQSATVHSFDESMDANVNDQSKDASVGDASAALGHSDQSDELSADSDGAGDTQDVDVDASAVMSDAEEADAGQTMEGSEAADESGEPVVEETYVVDDETRNSHASSSIGQKEADESQAFDQSQVSDDTQASDNSQVSDDEAPVEHDSSADSVDRDDSMSDASEATADASIEQPSMLDDDQSAVEQSESHITTTPPAETASDSINLDISLSADQPGTSTAAPTIDGALLPHPVVLIETLPGDSSAMLAWNARQAGSGSGVSRAVVAERSDISNSLIDKEAGDVSMADASVSVADAQVVETENVGEESGAMSRSGSVHSILSSLSSIGASKQDEEDEEAFRQKYQSSRDTVMDRSVTMPRRLSLSSDSEHESEAEEQSLSSHEEQDDEGEDPQDADEGSSRLDASQSKRAHSHVTDHEEELEDDDDEEEEQEVDDESALSDDGASSGEEQVDEEKEEDEDEDEDEEEAEEVEEMSEAEQADGDDDASSIRSQLDEEEQSASRLDSVVIISSSGSPSHTSSSSLSSLDESEQDEEDEHEEEESYVVSVVRDSRDRSIRASEHSAIDDEPEIHTLHLRQPAPRPTSLVDDTHHSQTIGDASHSRSRVLKLGQATSTPIVEISSLDPRAAARATAILKLFHKYVDEGWIAGTEMGDATEGRMHRVVDAIHRADRQGRRLEDASELQQLSVAASEREGADLTTLLMDAELSLAREGTESFFGSMATSVRSAVAAMTASPATPFLPGGFRASPADADAGAGAGQTASPSTTAAARSALAGGTGDISSTSTTVANQSKRKRPPISHSFTFSGLSTPDRTSSHRPPAKQARLSAALTPPSLDTFNPRVWDTNDWVRLDRYFTSGVKKISSHLISSPTFSSREAKAESYVDALLGIDVDSVAELFLDGMRIPEDRRTSEWAAVKVEHRLLALQRKYLRKVEGKYPNVLRGQEVGEGGEDSMATEDLDWSLSGNTTAVTEREATGGRAGRVSFGTPYRMGAHSTPAVGLLKKATSRAARAAQEQQRGQQMYPPLPASSSSSTTDSITRTTEAGEEGVITKATKLISRLSGSFTGLIASPRPSPSSTTQTTRKGADKGKRKATEAELEPSTRIAAARRVDDIADHSASTASSSDSTVDSLLSVAGQGVTSTINASLFTNTTSILPDSSNPKTNAAPTRPPTSTTTQTRPPTISTRSGAAPQEMRSGGKVNLTSSLQLAGGSSGVSHTPLSLLSPATHRAAARKVDELRQSRALRNWTSPRRQRLGLHRCADESVAKGGGVVERVGGAAGGRNRGAERVSVASSGSGSGGSVRRVSAGSSEGERSGGSVSLADVVTSDAARVAVGQKRRSAAVARRR